MKGTFRFSDPFDLTPEHPDGAPGFDLNTWGNGDPFGLMLLGDVDFGTNEIDAIWANNRMVRFEYPVVEMNFKIAALGPDGGGGYDQLVEWAEAIATNLGRRNAIEFQPDDAAEPRWFDIWPGPMANLFHGQALALNKIIGLLLDNEGLPLRVYRHPAARGPRYDGGSYEISNSFGGAFSNRSFAFLNSGNADSEAKLTITPNEAGAKVVRLRMGRRTRYNLAENAEQSVVNLDSATPDLDTAVVADAGGASGQVLRTTFATSDRLKRRWHTVIETASANALKGRYRAFLVVKPMAAGEYHLQLRWADGDREEAESVNARVVFDGGDLGSFFYVEVPAGFVRAETDQLTLEGWASRVDGGGDLRWSELVLIPADEAFTTLQLPGVVGDGSNATRWEGGEFTDATAGGVGSNPTWKDDVVRLNHDGEAVAHPGAPDLLDSGRHRVTVEVELRDKRDEHAKQKLGELQVRRNGAVIESINLVTRKNRHTTRRNKTVQFDAAGPADEYEFRVVMTDEPADAAARITVKWMRHSFQRFASQGDSFVLDLEARDYYLVQQGRRVGRFVSNGGFAAIGPGPNLITTSLGVITGSGYDDVIDAEELTRSDPSISADVQVEVIPRYRPL